MKLTMLMQATDVNNKWTDDSLYEGRLILRQGAKGYRFSIDSPLLTWFAYASKRFQRCADLGAGSGVVGLGLLATQSEGRLYAIELQQQLADYCSYNAQINQLDSRVEVHWADLNDFAATQDCPFFDLVVSNPPFWPKDCGRLPSSAERRIACHEIETSLDQWIHTARRIIHPRKGRLCTVFPAQRLADLMAVLLKKKFFARRMCFVHPKPGETAELVLVEARPTGPCPLTVESPLFLKNSQGQDTQLVSEILKGEFSTHLRNRIDSRIT